MSRRRKKQRSGNGGQWLIRAFIGLMFVLLLLSLWLKKNPQNVVRDAYYWALGENDKISLSPDLWEQKLAEKEETIDSLEREITICKKRFTPANAVVQTNDTELNMRSYPSTDSDILYKIPNGSKVDVLSIDFDIMRVAGSEGNWVKIRSNDQVGYVFSSYLEFIY